MALRDFTDSNGITWTAWDIPPTRSFESIRGQADRRARTTAEYSPERRRGDERRQRTVPPQLLHGWVCFESESEKRRLIPPPPRWSDASDEELEALCRAATPHPKLPLELRAEAAVRRGA